MEITTAFNRTYLSLKDKYNKINSFQLAIFSSSGWGKGLTTEAIVEDWKESTGGIVLIIADPKKEAEFSFVQYKPKERYHLDRLKLDGIIPKTHSCKMYHPFTENIPKYYLPEINFFTIPIKSMIRQDWSILAESSADTESIKLLLRVSEGLGRNDGLFNFLHEIERLSEGVASGKKFKRDPKNFGLRVRGGSAKSVTEIAGLLSPFKRNYFLRKQTCPHVLNWEEILTDNESYHVFLSMWLEDEKLQHFMVLNLINQILSNRHYAKKPILLVIPEVRVLCPRNPLGYKFFLSQAITKALSTIRSMGRGISSIVDSQNFEDTDDKIKGSATITLFGQLAPNDSERVAKAMQYKREIREQLQNMTHKNSYLIAGKEYQGAMRFFLPSHCHAEEEYNWIEMYRKHGLPMKRYTDLIKEMKNEFLDEIKVINEKTKKEIKEEKEIREQVKVNKQNNDSSSKEKYQEREDKDKNRLMKLCYEMWNDSNLSKREKSFRAIGEKFEIHHLTAKKYILSWKNKLDEENSPEAIKDMVGDGVLPEEVKDNFKEDKESEEVDNQV